MSRNQVVDIPNPSMHCQSLARSASLQQDNPRGRPLPRPGWPRPEDVVPTPPCVHLMSVSFTDRSG